MQLVFDTIEELKQFITECGLTGVSTHQNGLVSHAAVAAPRHESVDEETPLVRRGRKPKQPVAHAYADSADEEWDNDEPTTRKEAAPTVSRPRSAVSLTDRIRKVIDQFIENQKEFTANDVYALIAKKDKEVNKQSVITSVLKQMNSNYVHIRFEEREGRGPRKVKMYIPE